MFIFYLIFGNAGQIMPYEKLKVGIKRKHTWEVKDAAAFDKTLFLKTTHTTENQFGILISVVRGKKITLYKAPRLKRDLPKKK